MKSLLLDLAPLGFGELMELARAVIPTSAPAWTDHNVHDPGIMLAELLAFVADAQGYSISRVRKDERTAYARLLGITARGPTPARGLLWPAWAGNGPAPWGAGAVVASTAAITGETEDTPTFHVTEPILLGAAALVDLFSELGDGRTRKWTRINVEDGAAFYPFGDPLDPDSRLVLKLRGDLTGPAPSPGARVSLGFEIVPPQASHVCPDEEPGPHASRLVVELTDGLGTRPLRVVSDTTAGFLHSGVLLLEPPQPAPSGDTWTIVLRIGAQGLLRSPHVRRIALNVLPVVQQEAVDEYAQAPEIGTGLPDQSYGLRRATLMTEGAPIAKVRLDGTSWSEAADLAKCDPDQNAFVLDHAQGVLRFGNGVNGRAPAPGSTLHVQYHVTDGGRGNVARPTQWNVPGVLGAFGRNSEPLAGGADAQTLADLRRIARLRTESARPIVTRSDLAEAALALCDLRVARAFEPSPDALRGHHPRGLRTLFVVAAGDDGDRTLETPTWLAAVRARLVGRLPLGQRLEVRAPRYVTVGVKATLVAEPLARPEDVASAAATRLREKLRIVAATPADAQWPFSRDVAMLTVKGWLRRVEGVARVDAVTLYADGAPVAGPAVSLGPVGLPFLELAAGDIQVARWSSRVSP